MSNCHPRSLARSVAKAKMKKQGLDNVNKKFFYKGSIFPSYFAMHWREVLADEFSK